MLPRMNSATSYSIIQQLKETKKEVMDHPNLNLYPKKTPR